MTIDLTISIGQRAASRVSHRFARAPLALRRAPLALALAFGLGVVGEVVAHDAAASGTVWLVTNCNDAGSGSLREAYASAGDGDTVDLSELACSTITLTSGALTSAADAGYVTLQGSRYSHLTLSGNHADRVLVHNGSRLAVQDVDVTAGVAHDARGGGCIYSSGGIALLEATVSNCEVSASGTVAAKGGGVRAASLVVLRRSRVTGNRVHAAHADADGGGIHALDVITAFQNTISGNTASGDGSHYARGGGIFAGGYLRIDDATVSGNQAEGGGGIYVGHMGAFGTSRLTNTTISGNRASGAAGGILAGRSIQLNNSTVTNNTAVFDFGAGLYLAAGDVELHSTIVANNSSGDGLNAADIGGHSGATVAGAHSLVIASTLSLPAGTLTGDPMLGPLADNGGGVETHALRAGSPAIDSGENPLGLSVDERGTVCPPVGPCVPAERVVGAAADMGAFEFGAPNHIFADGFDPET